MFNDLRIGWLPRAKLIPCHIYQVDAGQTNLELKDICQDKTAGRIWGATGELLGWSTTLLVSLPAVNLDY